MMLLGKYSGDDLILYQFKTIYICIFIFHTFSPVT